MNIFLLIIGLAGAFWSLTAATPADEDAPKAHLRKLAVADGWNENEISRMETFLSDPRAAFKPEILVRGAAHRETAALYAHHTDDLSVRLCIAYIDSLGAELARGIGNSPVPLEVVVAILKVESNLGRWPARERVFNVYWTLSLAAQDAVAAQFIGMADIETDGFRRLKKRASWALEELRAFLKVGEFGHYTDPMSIMGSWAGAFGLCQFIPSSYLAYARDGDSDGVIDLDNPADAASSIANYLILNGWPRKPGQPEAERKAILRYNRSGPYADCILKLSDLLKRR